MLYWVMHCATRDAIQHGIPEYKAGGLVVTAHVTCLTNSGLKHNQNGGGPPKSGYASPIVNQSISRLGRTSIILVML